MEDTDGQTDMSFVYGNRSLYTNLERDFIMRCSGQYNVEHIFQFWLDIHPLYLKRIRRKHGRCICCVSLQTQPCVLRYTRTVKCGYSMVLCIRPVMLIYIFNIYLVTKMYHLVPNYERINKYKFWILRFNTVFWNYWFLAAIRSLLFQLILMDSGDSFCTPGQTVLCPWLGKGWKRPVASLLYSYFKLCIWKHRSFSIMNLCVSMHAYSCLFHFCLFYETMYSCLCLIHILWCETPANRKSRTLILK
jgi:hypothetical protein